jgi:Uma2 family endonuclease
MATAEALITVDEFRDMDFDVPVELVRGEVVELPGPNTWHGYICACVVHALKLWDTSNAGFVIASDSGVLTERNPDTLRGPDVYFIGRERLPDGRLPERWIEVAPDLAVEVVSPSDSWRHLWEMIHEYFALGVREVWVIDPRKRRVHVMESNDEPRILSDVETLESAVVLRGFSCPVSDLLPPRDSGS